VNPSRDRIKHDRADLGDVLIICLAGGVLAAALEVGTLGTFRVLLPRVSRISDSFIWVVPLYYCVVFGALGLGFALLTRFLPRRGGLQLAASAAAALAVFVGLLLGLYGTTSQWALGILAVGAGVQVGRWGAGHPEKLGRAARITTVALGLPLVLMAVGIPAYTRWKEGNWTRHLPPARAGAPNILLIILDTVRAASTGLHGHIRPSTPRLSGMAEHSIVFDRAYSTAPWTLPSHATMFTGRYPSEISANWVVPLDDRFATLAEVLRDAGYQTGGFVANMTYTSRETGLARGFIHYEDYPFSRQYLRRATALSYFLDTWDRAVKPSRRTLARKMASRINADFLSWLDRREGKPFFAFLNYFEAHQPYRYYPEFGPQFKTGNEVQDHYEAAIATMDLEISRLTDSLSRRGLLENTIIIVTSDHGELLGEFNLQGHANSLHSPLLHVPLLIHHTAANFTPRRIAEPVTLRDLPATIAAMAGVNHRFPGSPLSRFWDSTAAPTPGSPVLAQVKKGIRTPPEEPVSLGDMASIIRGHLQLIQNGDGRRELYDLRVPADQSRNLFDASTQLEDVAALVAALRESSRLLPDSGGSSGSRR
jgi:arylsulfatase A-like enzyme